MGVFNQIKMIWHKRSSSAYIKYLRKKGIHIGEHCIIRAPRTARIDVSRPSLVTIGNNVDMNMNFQILTHDWASLVFRTKYNDFVNSSGHVTIGNNIYFGNMYDEFVVMIEILSTEKVGGIDVANKVRIRKGEQHYEKICMYSMWICL